MSTKSGYFYCPQCGTQLPYTVTSTQRGDTYSNPRCSCGSTHIFNPGLKNPFAKLFGKAFLSKRCPSDNYCFESNYNYCMFCGTRLVPK